MFDQDTMCGHNYVCIYLLASYLIVEHLTTVHLCAAIWGPLLCEGFPHNFGAWQQRLVPYTNKTMSKGKH